jgi:hypothetical protein
MLGSAKEVVVVEAPKKVETPKVTAKKAEPKVVATPVVEEAAVAEEVIVIAEPDSEISISEE